ncbi:MAG TPA: TlpA disulfide reductase family protein [Gemmataceae bacterium]|nr:TlpA disulfide reductase family protein [Gemmataceae bacterium]
MTKGDATRLGGRTSFLCRPARISSWLTSCLLLGALSAPATAAPTVAQMLNFKPRQEGVVCTTPDADKHAGCKVELLKGGRGSGWILKDAEGNLVRRFFDSNGDNHIDVWAYYKDGVEVYAEIDTTYDGKPNQYRWLNAGGSKWGIDENKDGKIDSWKVISPEEVSQEILAALINKDFARLQPLLLTEAELKTLDLPNEQASRIREQLKSASEKFQKTVSKLTKLSSKATWIHLETVAPQCVAPEGSAGRAEVYKHTRGTLLYDNGGTSDWIQTGEMYLLGNAWRLVSAPVQGAAAPETPSGKAGSLDLGENPELQKLIAELTDLDKRVPPSNGSTNPALAEHHLKRADILERIVAKVKSNNRDPWIRQVADSLSTAAQSDPSNTVSMTRLLALERQLSSALPAGHALTAYVTYREMQAEYSRSLPPYGKEKDFNKVQEAWLARLAKFVQSFPRGEDTPDALLQAGMVSEFLNKEVEAKNWYKQLKDHFGDKAQARKAEGSIARLELEGKTLKLSGPMLNDPNIAFDMDQKHGKVVIVYYWASWNNQCTSDFTKLKGMLDTHSGKVDLVCVNLDNSSDEARSYLQSTRVPGTHLHQDGGLESKMATDYGIQVLPTIFVVGKDGKVVNRNGQIANLEDEVKKLVK